MDSRRLVAALDDEGLPPASFAPPDAHPHLEAFRAALLERQTSRFPGVNDFDHVAKVVSMHLIGAETARIRFQHIPPGRFQHGR